MTIQTETATVTTSGETPDDALKELKKINDAITAAYKLLEERKEEVKYAKEILSEKQLELQNTVRYYTEDLPLFESSESEGV